MVEYLKASLEAQARGSVRVIEGTIEPAAATAPALTSKNRLKLEVEPRLVRRSTRSARCDRHRARDLQPMAATASPQSS